MIVAEIENRYGETEFHEINGLANRGEWFGETWLVSQNIGVFCYKFIVEGDNEQDIVDAFTDSRLGHMIITDVLCDYCEEGDYDNCECDYAGNASERIDLSYFHIYGKCKVHYFENRDNWEGITAWGGLLHKVK